MIQWNSNRFLFGGLNEKVCGYCFLSMCFLFAYVRQVPEKKAHEDTATKILTVIADKDYKCRKVEYRKNEFVIISFDEELEELEEMNIKELIKNFVPEEVQIIIKYTNM